MRDDAPVDVNLVPYASEMHAWLRREQIGLSSPAVFRSAHLEEQRNPYTAALATIAGSFAMVVNDATEFIESSENCLPAEAEIRRVRFECELILYAARFCEATIKQMLHCTSFPAKIYRRAAMGQLLDQDCFACRKANAPTHRFSLLGSLAHHFFLCHEIDGCALDHLIIANQRRNLDVAHANAPALDISTPEESKSALATKMNQIVGNFAHLLGHIAKIEEAMIREIEIRIAHFPDMPPFEAYRGFLTRTVADYDSSGVYQGPGYGDKRRRQLREKLAKA